MFLPVRYQIQTGHALSSGSPGSICFFQPLSPATPTACLAVSLAYDCYRRRDGVTTFLLVDPLDDLGAPSTPVVPQFRAGSYKTCILTTRYSHRGAAFDLIILGRSALVYDAYRHLISFTISSVPSPYRRRILRRVLLLPFKPISVRCQRGFTPCHQRNSSMPA